MTRQLCPHHKGVNSERLSLHLSRCSRHLGALARARVQVIVANMVRELWEDGIRHADDRAVNHRRVDVAVDGRVEQVPSHRCSGRSPLLGLCTTRFPSNVVRP